MCWTVAPTKVVDRRNAVLLTYENRVCLCGRVPYRASSSMTTTSGLTRRMSARVASAARFES